VTTNSDGGIENYEDYYEVFGEMERSGLVLNLHGEVPSDAERVSLERNKEGRRRASSPFSFRVFCLVGNLRSERRRNLPSASVQDSQGFPEA